MSGLYKIIDDNNETFQVFCDFNSEPGFAWNLIQSFSLSNKDQMKVTYNSEIGSVCCSSVVLMLYFILACLTSSLQAAFKVKLITYFEQLWHLSLKVFKLNRSTRFRAKNVRRDI